MTKFGCVCGSCGENTGPQWGTARQAEVALREHLDMHKAALDATT